jgi:hypothetical protein
MREFMNIYYTIIGAILLDGIWETVNLPRVGVLAAGLPLLAYAVRRAIRHRLTARAGQPM